MFHFKIIHKCTKKGFQVYLVAQQVHGNQASINTAAYVGFHKQQCKDEKILWENVSQEGSVRKEDKKEKIERQQSKFITRTE